MLDLLDTLSSGHTVRVSRVWQALVQDDDVRVPFGKVGSRSSHSDEFRDPNGPSMIR